ncbi:hypothetical protein CDL12_06090 [Handroanthus impetiginosus]|uniref:BRX domain-containing protein n=1 Tax=Handroanthus impetiginosus TaxID=429701 RepID=A0A2G9HUL0_9LAMI|nr:hypothetical protein CDL12_06090 [Handroanthus impetiginosus]
MSEIYDNWERLVAAVLKREEIWELCHAPSLSSSSFSSISSDYFYSNSSYQFDDQNLISAKPKVQEWIEKYEPGVAHGDASKEIKRTRFSWTKIFNGKVAETRLYNSKEKAGKKYKDPNKLASLGRNELLPLSDTTFDQSMRSRNSEVLGNASSEIVSEWVDNYEPGVYVVLGDLGDGTRDVLLVGFSWRRFKVDQAKAWWRSNQKKLYQNKRVRQSSRFKETDNLTVVEWIEEYKTGDATQVHLRQETGRSFIENNGIPLLALVKDTILEINFDEILRSANLDGPIGSSHQPVRAEVIERYEPGVYLSLEYSDSIRDVERVRFSRNIFKPHEAVAWWIKNRENVCHIYRMP